MANVKTALVRWVEGMAIETLTQSGHPGWIDAAPKDGTPSKGPSPMELVLVGLAGCTAMDVVDILRKKRLAVTGLEVRVEGVRAETHPMVYTQLAVTYIVRGKEIPASAVAQAIQLSEEKYCSVGAMLGKTAQLTSRFEIVAE